MIASTRRTLACLMLALPVVAGAQSFPNRPLRIIVAAPPGGGVDIVGRILATRLGENLGQQVVVDNRVGASGLVGTEAAAKAPPDGHTLLLGTMGNLAINPTLYRNVPFNVAKDFAPITQVAFSELMIVVHPSLPAHTLSDLIKLAKAQPGKVSYGSSGIGGGPHLAVELFSLKAGIKLTHVPYKGSGPAYTDLLGGHIPLLFDTLVQGAPFVRSGKLRALAVLTGTRSTLLPDVPTVSETLPGYAVTNWYGLMVQAAVPDAIQRRLRDPVIAILRDPEIKELFAKQGVAPVGSSSEEFAAFLKSETASWAKVIKEANVRPE